MQIKKILFPGMVSMLCLTSVTLAQPKQAAAPSSPVIPSSQTTAVTSAPLLASPFMPPADRTHLLQEMGATKQAFALARTGDELAARGDWPDAQRQYLQALDVTPNSGLGHLMALYGLIAYCRTTGDTTKGLEYSRQAIYIHGSAAGGYSENDTAKLMQFVLLLQQTGQNTEAVQVYNHAAFALDYRDGQFNGGKPYLDVLLPEIVAGDALPSQIQYTPDHLHALANVAIAHEEICNNNKEAVAYMEEAVKLYPDSFRTHYYLGETLPSSDPRRKAEYQKAVDLGDEATVAAAKERMKMIP